MDVLVPVPVGVLVDVLVDVGGDAAVDGGEDVGAVLIVGTCAVVFRVRVHDCTVRCC